MTFRNVRTDEFWHPSLNIICVVESRSRSLAGHVTGMGDRRGAYKVLVGKSERKRTL